MSFDSEQSVGEIAWKGSRVFSLQVVSEHGLRVTSRLGPRQRYRGFCLQVVNELGLRATCKRGARGVSKT